MIWLPLLLVAGAAALAKSRGVSLGAAPGQQQQQQQQQQRPRGLGDLPDTEGPGFRRVGGRPVTAVDDNQRVIARGTLDALAFAGAQRPFAARGGYDDGGVDNYGSSRASGTPSGTGSVGAPSGGPSAGTATASTGPGSSTDISAGPGLTAAITQTINGLVGIGLGVVAANPLGIVAAVNNTVQGIVAVVQNITVTTVNAIGFPAAAAEDAAVDAQAGIFGVPGPEAVGLSTNDVGVAADAEGGAVDAGPSATPQSDATGTSGAASSSLGFSTPADVTVDASGNIGGPGGSPSNAAPGFSAGQSGGSPSDTGPAGTAAAAAAADTSGVGAPGVGAAPDGPGGTGTGSDGGDGDGGD